MLTHGFRRHTAIWTMAYGTVDEATAENATACATAQQSHQSWQYNTTFNVESESDGLAAQESTATWTLSPTPTGEVWVSSNHGSRTVVASAGLFVGPAAMFLLHVLS